jgi:hypothetical protein
MIIADVRMAAGSAEPFARVLLDTCPHAGSRLVVACAGEEELSSAEHSVRRVRKPFNPRDLRSVARELLQ